MPTRFNIYFNEEEEPLLEEAKRRIDNLSEFFKNILREHLQIAKNVPETPTEVQRPDAGVIFQKKFADFETEADVRNVFEDRIGAEQALKNRLAELKRACPQEFPTIKELFHARYPRYAKITDEL
ncbi:MAG: hypothetical protein IJA20_07330 [Methanocorpusculum sp.]|nr:hypothetical protein [Methanocorpusculum sp.]